MLALIELIIRCRKSDRFVQRQRLLWEICHLIHELCPYIEVISLSEFRLHSSHVINTLCLISEPIMDSMVRILFWDLLIESDDRLIAWYEPPIDRTLALDESLVVLIADSKFDYYSMIFVSLVSLRIMCAILKTILYSTQLKSFNAKCKKI